MRHFFTISLAIAVLVSGACSPGQTAQGSPPPTLQPPPSGSGGLVVARHGTQAARRGPVENFTGSVVVTPLFQATEHTRAAGAYVTFEAGARSAWHSHPVGQTLVVTAGVGWVQAWGGEKHEIRPGDVVWTPPGVKHWHGATATTSMTHMAIQEHAEGKVVEWMEQVSDEQYLK